MASYADVADYELRTGIDVPPDKEPTIQARLDDTSALIELYLGDCADEVEAACPEILTALTVSHTYRISTMKPGVKSESVGGTAVEYASVTEEGMGLSSALTDVLDELMDKVCGTSGVPGLGSVGAHWGGRGSPSDTRWMRDVDVWVM
jgi:hypothetical protein